MQLLLEREPHDVWLRAGGGGRAPRLQLLVRGVGLRSGAGPSVLHCPGLDLSLRRSERQVPSGAGVVVAVSPAPEHRGVERDPAVRAAGAVRPGVRHLPVPARERPGERRVPALLLQTGVQPERVEPPPPVCHRSAS